MTTTTIRATDHEPAIRALHCTHPDQDWCDCDWCRHVRETAYRLQRDENARLIAAASELLGELARALRYIETPGDFQPREHAEIVDDLSALLARITTP